MMSATVWLLSLLAAVGILLIPQLNALLGRSRGIWVALAILGILISAWRVLERSGSRNPPRDWAAVPSSNSESCQKCHADHYQSWYQTYHRSMTREATPENVKGNFENVVHDYQGLKSRFYREGDAFFMETVDPEWAFAKAKAGDAPFRDPPKSKVFRVDRLVGSHWLQECLHQMQNGRLIRLPVLYHIGEKKWIHTNGSFLAPDAADFWHKCRNGTWNDTCLYCHNTGPSKNPILDSAGRTTGYKTTVAELGISCEACHGPAGEHVSRNQNPAYRYKTHDTGKGDSSIVNPLRLSNIRSDEICGRCHGALVPRAEMWNFTTMKDPYIAGLDLTRFNYKFQSEAEQAMFGKRSRKDGDPRVPPTPTDGRFWGDGTPLTTGLEYNGMALSGCYQGGHGKMSCLSCHEMHGSDPNHLLKPKMRTNEACYQCHGEYREKLAEHTRHQSDSTGSSCVNCHMPHVVYSLLTTHRSHRIEVPTLEGSVGTGKPHACNLCHLDKSLGWTRDELAKWPGQSKRKRVQLSEDEERIASSVLLLAQGDARTRVIVAAAFANSQPGTRDWHGPFLTRFMQHDRFPAVRYQAHRALQLNFDAGNAPYDFLGVPDVQREQLQRLQSIHDSVPIPARYPYLPLTALGLPDDAILTRLRLKRTDPDLSINE